MSEERLRKPLERIGLEVLDLMESQLVTAGIGVIVKCRSLVGKVSPRLEQRRSLLLPSQSEMTVLFEIARRADAGDLPTWSKRRGTRGMMPIEHPAAEYRPIWYDGVICGVEWVGPQGNGSGPADDPGAALREVQRAIRAAAEGGEP